MEGNNRKGEKMAAHNDLERQIEDLGVELNNRVQLLEEVELRMLRNRIGTRVDDMMQNRNLAEELLLDDEEDVRDAAILILVRLWGEPGEYVDHCREIACNDASLRVRDAAIHLLWQHCVTERTEHEIKKLIASFVLDDSEPNTVRLSAYKALIYATKKSVDWEPPVACLEFPGDVNWDFVKSEMN